jgi:acyl-CoA thioesterase
MATVAEVFMSNESSSQQAQHLAEKITELLYTQDRASRALGIRIDETRPGYARATMVVRSDMTNGHHIAHGGLVFTLADTAFAFACNSHNESNVAASASIDFLAPSHEGDELTAVATELWRSGRSGIYEITVTNQKGARIALFRGRSARIAGQVVSDD